MDNLTATALQSMIHKQFESWQGQDAVMDEIERALFHGCREGDSHEEVCARAILNSMEIAAEIVIMEILIANNVIRLADEEQIRKSIISVVK